MQMMKLVNISLMAKDRELYLGVAYIFNTHPQWIDLIFRVFKSL